ncbi:MAG: hypothetical protein HC806_10155 [Anaerolineae bacterium]|nr:hypothetical protein [Anaerolineae bacterium]
MSAKKDWKEKYEDAATDEKEQFSKANIEKLLQDIRKGEFGEFHTIWPAIAENATLEQAGWTLFRVLVSDAEYLPRYHAAAALLKLMQVTTFEAVNLSAVRPELQTNLETVREMLVQKIGEPKNSPVEVQVPVQKGGGVVAKKPKKWYQKLFGGK